MRPKPDYPQSGKLFISSLREQVNLKHPLVKLADIIDWERIHALCSEPFISGRGRPATSPRLVQGCCICNMPLACRTMMLFGDGLRILIGKYSLVKRICK
jgi:hypothetical protein